MIFSCTWLLVGGFSVSWKIYQEHAFVYLCWGTLIWYYTSIHGLPKDKLIWMSLRRSILFPSQHSLKVFHVFAYWFHSWLNEWLLHCPHYNKNNKKIEIKNGKQTKNLEGLNYESVWVVSVIKCRYQIKARLRRSSFWKVLPIKTTRSYRHFTLVFLPPLLRQKTPLFPFQSFVVAKIVKIKIGRTLFFFLVSPMQNKYLNSSLLTSKNIHKCFLNALKSAVSFDVAVTFSE